MLRKTGAIPLLLAPILAPIVYPFLFIVLVLNEIVRGLVIGPLLFLIYGKKVQLVEDAADGFWASKRKGGSRNVITYMTCPFGRLDADKVAKYYRAKVQNFRDKNGIRPYKKFEQIMTTKLGYPCWEEPKDKFNVDNHIRTLKDDKMYTVNDIQDLLSDLVQDMGEEKPQWEIVHVPRYDDNSGQIKSLFIFSFLHSYFDALSFMILCKEHLTPDAEYTIDPIKFRIPVWKKALLYLNTVIYGAYLVSTFLIERLMHIPWIKRDNQEDQESKKHFAFMTGNPISHKVINKIRTYHGLNGTASVTNVLTLAFVNSVIKVLPKERIVDEIVISELVAYLPYPNSHPQNRFAYFNFPVPTDKDNIWDKLRTIKNESWTSMIQGPEILASFYFFKIAGRMPTFLSPLWLMGSPSSIVLSNAPFSRTRVHFDDGTEILEMGGFTPQPNDNGLSIAATRYCDDVKVFGCSDSRWLSQSELSDIINQIPNEIDAMLSQIEDINMNVGKDKNDRIGTKDWIRRRRKLGSEDDKEDNNGIHEIEFEDLTF